MASAVLCDSWSAHRARLLGLVNQVVPAYRLDGKWIANPMVVTDRMLDDEGNLVYGEWKTGEAALVLDRLRLEHPDIDDPHHLPAHARREALAAAGAFRGVRGVDISEG